jgi:hypothetical protein
VVIVFCFGDGRGHDFGWLSCCHGLVVVELCELRHGKAVWLIGFGCFDMVVRCLRLWFVK